MNVVTFPENSIFNNKNFMRLWGAQISSQVGINILNFVLAVSIYNLTKSNQAVSYVVISYGFAAFLFGALAGVLVDYFNKKLTLLYSTVFRFSLVFLLLMVTQSVWLTVLLAFSLNSITQFFFPAEAASIPLLVRKRNLLVANSLYTLSYYGSQMAGYIGAGMMLEKFGFTSVVYAIATLFLIAAAFIYSITYPAKATSSLGVDIRRVTKRIAAEFEEGVKYIGRSRTIKESLAYIGTSQIIIGVFFALVPGYAVEVLGLKAEETSLYLIAPATVGMILGALMLGTISKKLSTRKILNIGIFGASLGFVCISVTQRIPIEKIKLVTNRLNGFQTYLPDQINRFLGIDVLLFAVISMVIIGVANSFIVIVSNTRLQKRSKESMRGRIYGVLQTLVTVLGFAPVILAGYFADRIGINEMLFSVSVLIILIHVIIRLRIAKR